MQSSARRGIQSPSLDRSDRPDVPLHISYLVAALEKDPSLDQGSFSARPSNPGYARYFYWATDLKQLYFWDGSTWTNVGATDTVALSTIDAKGDLIAGLGDNLVGRLGVGSNGMTLQADNSQAQGMKWALDQVIDAIAGKGDLIVGTSADHIDRLGVGADGQALLADSAQSSGLRWGVIPSPYVQQDLAADVTVTGTNTYQNIFSINIPAGTHRIACHMTIVRAAGGAFFAKLYDGTNPAWASAAGLLGNTGDHSSVSFSKIITVGSTTAVTLAVASTGANNVVKAAFASNSAGNTATHLEALQIG